jgi:hypothetical protein
VDKEKSTRKSKWYSLRCVNYGKFPDTDFYRMCEKCRADMLSGRCPQFVRVKKTKKDIEKKEIENGIEKS